MKYIGLNAGLDIDDFAPRLSFFWGVGMNFYMVSKFCSEIPWINVHRVEICRKLQSCVQLVVFGQNL